MATLRYRRVPEPSLLNLSAPDVQVLHQALRSLKEMDNEDPTLDALEREALDALCDQVELIRKGEDIFEDSFIQDF